MTIVQTFDSDGNLISQVISPMHGPHPSLVDSSLRFNTLVPALS